MAGKLFVKNTLPSNAHAAADAHELEMFDLFGDHDTDLVDVVQIDEDEEALATGMWTDYSAVFPTLNQQGRALEQAADWQFVTCNDK